ncbi:undecaprenyl-phosphate glucose phosphotransferase [Vibrio hannami]|uniref:undecaprenyl-phosphate glucose phosphotransferase n=1 Tax=Vibrio hannami TaxID=2717094 RepID=UPI00240EDCAE|nr:undecaprenyl-phosphate glucose phosphotransferase [Vibrio hannami]MDG3087044.1 undecaprenyl-phosphate glucose phosphotransferase [Vibrio hannami]
MKKQVFELADNGYRSLMKVLDFLTINLCLCLLLETIGKEETAVDFSSAFMTSIAFLICGGYMGLYRHKLRHKFSNMTIKFLATAVLTIVIIELAKFPLKHLEGFQDNSLFPALRYSWLLIAMTVCFCYRPLMKFLAITIGKMRENKKNIAILGLTPAGVQVEREILNEYSKLNASVYFYDDRTVNRFGYLTKSDYKGNTNKLIDDIKNNLIDTVYVALPVTAKERFNSSLHMLSDTTVDTYLVPDVYTRRLGVSKISNIGNMSTFSVFASPFSGANRVIKRIEDLILGTLIVTMISPILLFVAIGVKLSSPGPVLFKQDRYGLGGKKIKVWKFRSMKVMENKDTVVQATKNDPRVTAFGSFIRRTSLDELPQFFNVVQGSMSIVGPRPHAVAHNEQYRKIVDNYMIRHKIKPGITGWAQINGYRGETDTVDKMEKRVEYDIMYLDNWSLWLDIKIVFLTIFKGFVSEQAY